MKKVYKGYYLSAKLVLNLKADAEYSGLMFSLDDLKKLSRTFKMEYDANKLLFYKGVPYRWDDKNKKYFMITYYPEYIACMEFAGLPVNVNKALERISQQTLKKIILTDKELKSIQKSKK